MSENDCEELQRQRDIAKRVLSGLNQQRIAFGLQTPPYVLIGIEQAEQQVREIEAQLDALGCGERRMPNNLPRRAPFFGREQEIARSLNALSPEERGWGLVVDGIGGIGKTALAVELAYRCQERQLFDGFIFTTTKQTRLENEGERPVMDSAASLEEMLGEVARLLGKPGIAQRPSGEKSQPLLDALRSEGAAGHRYLLIFDNLETLTLDEQWAVYDFLRRLPNACKAITTSRRRVGDGGVFLRLERLEWSAARELMADEMHRSLVLQRALGAVAEARWQELYDAAGGSPLALRWLLGLMRARNLSLDRTLALARSGDKSDAPLHTFIYREARAEMGADDWRILAALSLFAKPASFDALTNVAGLTRTQLEATVERLDAYSLVDIGGPDGPYGLHSLTRRLAVDELAAQPELAHDLRGRFHRYWLDYAQKYGGSGKDAYKTFDRLEAEWPNLEAAAASLWALTGLPGPLQDKEAARMLVDLARELRQFTWFRGYWNERIRLGEWGYEVAKALGDWQAAGWLADSAAVIHYQRKETDQAEVWSGRMSEAMERSGTRRDWTVVTRMRGLLARQRGDLTEAERLHTETLAEFRALGEEAGELKVLSNLGDVARAQKGYDLAEAYYREALAISEKHGDLEGQAHLSGNLGQLAQDRERLNEARAWCEKALKLAIEVGREDIVASNQSCLAQVLEKEGRHAEALPLAEAALRIHERLGHMDMEVTRELVERLRGKV